MAATKPALQDQVIHCVCLRLLGIQEAFCCLHAVPCGLFSSSWLYRRVGTGVSQILPPTQHPHPPTQAWPTQGAGLGFSSTHAFTLRKLQQAVRRPVFLSEPALWTPFLKFKCQNTASFLFGVFKTHLSQEGHVLRSNWLHGGEYQRQITKGKRFLMTW